MKLAAAFLLLALALSPLSRGATLTLVNSSSEAHRFTLGVATSSGPVVPRVFTVQAGQVVQITLPTYTVSVPDCVSSVEYFDGSSWVASPVAVTYRRFTVSSGLQEVTGDLSILIAPGPSYIRCEGAFASLSSSTSIEQTVLAGAFIAFFVLWFSFKSYALGKLE